MISIVPMLAVLTTAAELRQAVWSGVHEGERFSIECTVTAAMDKDNPDHSAYSIMDASGATYMKSTGRLLIEPGAHVKISGHIGIDERTRLATEIHDAISQTLTGVSFQIDAAAKTLPTDTSASARFLAVARRTLLSCREELRRCIWDLRSNTLGMDDFSEAVEKTVRQGTGDAKLSVRFAIRREQLSDSTAHAILCVVREFASSSTSPLYTKSSAPQTVQRPSPSPSAASCSSTELRGTFDAPTIYCG